jgi:two-component system sensor histidine kinase GlrK
VADSGPGVAPDDRDRIFEAFYQGRQLQGGPVGGTGIGLSVVHECVLAHSGTIEIKPESELGGAHFVVRLGLSAAEDEAARSKPRLVVANG